MLGVYVVLRRIVFVGAALAQLSSAGIALGLCGSRGVGVGGGLTGTSGGALARRDARRRRCSSASAAADARAFRPTRAIGVDVRGRRGALAILLIAKAAAGEAHDIFLQGNILGITRADTLVLLAVSVPVLLVHVVFYKEFLFVSFDRETARTLGYRVEFWNLLLYFTLGLVDRVRDAVRRRDARVQLPRAAGRDGVAARAQHGGRLRRGRSGPALAAAVIGFTLSVPFDLPTGPAIIAVSGASRAFLRGR